MLQLTLHLHSFLIGNWVQVVLSELFTFQTYFRIIYIPWVTSSGEKKKKKKERNERERKRSCIVTERSTRISSSVKGGVSDHNLGYCSF